MPAKPQRYTLLSFSFTALAKTVFLTPVGLLIFYQLIYMSFFYEYEANESPIPPEDFAKAWALFGTIASVLLYNAYQGITKIGIGPGWRHTSWHRRKQAIEEGLAENVLLSMAFYDPVEDVKKAAASKIAPEILLEAYENAQKEDKWLSNAIADEMLAEAHLKNIRLQAKTIEGFQELEFEDQKSLLNEVDECRRKEYLLHVKCDNFLIKQLPTIKDKGWLESVALNKTLDRKVRKKALASCGKESTYEKILADEDAHLREEAIEFLLSANKAVLLDHLPQEEHQGLAKLIVKAIDKEADLLECLGPHTSKASAAVIIDSIEDAELLSHFLNEAPAPQWMKKMFEKRLKSIAKKLRKQTKKTQPGDGDIIAQIKDGRLPRNNRIAATTKLAQLLPECEIVIQEGTQPAWHCPVCADDGTCIMKPKHYLALERQVNNGALVTIPPCPRCGQGQSAKDVYGGKFDVIMVDILCPHCSLKMAGPIDSWIESPCHSCTKPVVSI